MANLRTLLRASPALLLLLSAACGGEGGATEPQVPGQPGDCGTRSSLVAHAGEDATVFRNTWATFDGTRSMDTDGGRLGYRWLVTAPDGTTLNASTGGFTPTASFVASMPGVYRGTLVVTGDDCHVSKPDTVELTVVNRAPTASAGPDRSVRKRTALDLSAAGSADPDRDTLTHAWRVVSGPPGAAPVLAGASSATATLTSEVPGDYVVGLVVHDGAVASAEDTAVVTVFNTAPVANANADQEASARATVTLSAAGSTDADADALTYQWAFAARPAGSAAALTGATGTAPTFVADVDGRYELDLVVHDGTVASAADRVVVTVYRYIHRIDYRVVDAVYSRGLERVVAVSATPHVLHVYDPVTETESTVALPMAPSSVAVSPDGRKAVVGHDGRLTLVDLVALQVVGTPWAVASTVRDVALTATTAYALGGSGIYGTVHAFTLSTGKETVLSTTGLRNANQMQLHAAGTALYTSEDWVSPEDLNKVSLSATTGAATFGYDSKYHGDYDLWSNLWLTEDGKYLLAASGRIFTTVPTATSNAGDLLYAGALEGHTQMYAFLQWADHDATTNRIAVIPGVLFASPPDADTRLQLFSGDFFQLLQTEELPRFVLAGKGHASHGRFVFHGADGSRRVVLVQADASANLATQDQGFVLY